MANVVTGDSQALRRLVESVVREQLARQGLLPASRSCGLPAGDGEPVTVLFTGATGTLDAALKQLASLAPRNVRLTAVLSASARELIGEQRLRETRTFTELCAPGDTAAATAAVANSKLLVLPTLTCGTAAKVALGLVDSLPSQLIVQALAAGTPVVAAAEAADPAADTGWLKGLAQRSPSLAGLLKDHLNTLQRHGVQVVPLSELCDTCLGLLTEAPGKNLKSKSRPTREIVTTEDLERAADRGHLRVAPDAIVTDAARERAAELGIELVR